MDNHHRWGLAMDSTESARRFIKEYYGAFNFEEVHVPHRQVSDQNLWRQLWGDPSVLAIELLNEADSEKYQSAVPESVVLLPTPRLETLRHQASVNSESTK